MAKIALGIANKIPYDVNEVKSLSSEMLDDEEVITALISLKPHYLENASPRIRDAEKIVCKAVETNAEVLRSASPRQRHNRKVLLRAAEGYLSHNDRSPSRIKAVIKYGCPCVPKDREIIRAGLIRSHGRCCVNAQGAHIPPYPQCT